MDYLKDLLIQLFTDIGLPQLGATRIAVVMMLIAIGLLAGLIGFLGNRFITPIIIRLVEKTHTAIDDYFLNKPVLKSLWHVLPGFIFYLLFPYCLSPDREATAYRFVEAGARIYITVAFIMFIKSFLTNLSTYTTEQERFRNHHLVGIIQFLKLLVYSLGGIVIIAILFGKDPLNLIAGLGAAATILMLVFKDSILGLVAGIQLSANKMLKPGDWVTMKRLDINGIVEEVSLTTVKVRNFDNTISTVPPYTLVSDSFQNWEGMKAKGARRVKRALYIDIHTIHFCAQEELDGLYRKKLITKSEYENETATTNLTLFRHYAERFLAQQPDVLGEQDNTWLMARQLEPTPNGLPVELWFYFSETQFVRYEQLAAECMEHLIAMLAVFHLKHYQYPTDTGRYFPQTPTIS